MARLTSRVLAQASAITPTTLIHIVTTGDTSQSPEGSSYKAQLQQLIPIFSGASTTFTGGTVTGPTDFTSGLSATTISATTYYNLPPDVYVTGATYSNNTFVYTNTTGGTFDVSFNSVTGLTINGDLNVTGNTTTNGLTATTMSASTLFVNGVQITGDTYTTGATLNGNTIEFNRTDFTNAYSVDLTSIVGGGVDPYWVSGSTGTKSLKAVNTSGLDSTNDRSIAWGNNTLSSGEDSTAFGITTSATTNGATSSGRNTLASGNYSTAEGFETEANGIASHAEGYGSIAQGYGAHAEGGVLGGEPDGVGGYALGDASHAEGIVTSATTSAAHSEGFQTLASGVASHAEGSQTIASGGRSHAEGNGCVATDNQTHAEGYQTSATTTNAHSEGYQTLASGETSHAEGNQTIAGGLYSHSEGNLTTALEVASHAEGESTIANGYASHTEGYDTRTNADFTHAEGESVISGWRGFSVDSVTNGVITLNSTYGDVTSEFTSGTIILDKLKINYSTITFSSTTNTEIIITNTILNSGTYVNDLNNLNSLSADNIIGSSSHAEGKNTRALGERSHAEGFGSLSSGDQSHAEGGFTRAGGNNSHSEGYFTLATGTHSHSQNKETNARGFASHAEGNTTRAIGQYSHSEGSDTYAGYAGFNVISVVNGLVTLDSSYGDQTGLFSIGSTAIIDNKLSVITNSTFSSTTNTEIFLTDTSINVGSAIGITYDINNEFADTFGGNVTHAEGYQNKSFGDYSHTQNSFNTAIGSNTHAGGTNSIASGTTSFIHSTNSLVIADRSVVLGGQNITGTTTDTVYVPYLNIKNIGSGTSVNNLGIDVNGNVVSGTTGGGGSSSVNPFYDSGSGATITWNVSGQSTNYMATLTASTTLILTNVRNGDYGTIILTQDGVGSRTLTLSTVNGSATTHRVANGGGGSVTLTSNANAVDILTFTYNGTTMFWTVGNDYT